MNVFLTIFGNRNQYNQPIWFTENYKLSFHVGTVNTNNRIPASIVSFGTNRTLLHTVLLKIL